MDTIKFNKIPSSLSPARKILRPGSKGRNYQQTTFKDDLDRKRRKMKKSGSGNAKQSESGRTSSSRLYPKRAAGKDVDRPHHSKKSSHSRLIDIRV